MYQFSTVDRIKAKAVIIALIETIIVAILGANTSPIIFTFIGHFIFLFVGLPLWVDGEIKRSSALYQQFRKNYKVVYTDNGSISIERIFI